MSHDDAQAKLTGLTAARCVLVAFVGIAAYLLFLEHRAHLDGLLGYLPYLFLLACPLMHLFMHHGHHHHSPGDATERNDERRPQ